MKQFDQLGVTPLLISCDYVGTEPPKPILALLLENGAKITEVDDLGQGCLHYYLMHLDRSTDQRNGNISVISEERVKHDREALVYLIEKGADVQATDNLGFSVSHKVYTYPLDRSDLRRRVRYGSYSRDIWDFALVICGYDVFAIRGRFRRVGWYTPYYTTDNFRKLWQGCEHLCPYAEDLEGDMRDGTGGTESCCSWKSSCHGRLDNDDDGLNRCNRHGHFLACGCHDDEDDVDPDDDDGRECCRLCGWHRCCRDPICACQPKFDCLGSNGEPNMESDEDEDVASDTDSNDN